MLAHATSAQPDRLRVPFYVFNMFVPGSEREVGHVSLRVGDDPELVRYAGHVGYVVDEAHRGHHYAERSCRLILPLAKHHGLNPLWITCNPDNLPSRRTCERLGALYVETVEIPPHRVEYAGGERFKLRYKLPLE